jgi:hypothetical protein
MRCTSGLCSKFQELFAGSIDLEGRDNIVPAQNGTFVIVDPFVSQLSKLLDMSVW